jgi:hypothetical protein
VTVRSPKEISAARSLIGKQAFEEAECRRRAHTEASFETLGRSFFQLGCFQFGAIERRESPIVSPSSTTEKGWLGWNARGPRLLRGDELPALWSGGLEACETETR